MQLGQRFDPADIVMTEHETTAPELLSMEELLKLMQRHEIGTDATMGQHIETIQVGSFVLNFDMSPFCNCQMILC